MSAPQRSHRTGLVGACVVRRVKPGVVLGAKRERFALPPGSRRTNLEHQLEGDQMGGPESEELVCPQLPRAVPPLTEHERSVPERGPHDRGATHLDLDPCSNECHQATRFGAPFVPIDGPPEACCKIGQEPSPPLDVISRVGAKLLQDGQPQEIRRILAGRFVRPSEVPMPPAAIPDSQRQADSGSQDARGGRVARADGSGPRHGLRGEAHPVLHIVLVYRGRFGARGAVRRHSRSRCPRCSGRAGDEEDGYGDE